MIQIDKEVLQTFTVEKPKFHQMGESHSTKTPAILMYGTLRIPCEILGSPLCTYTGWQYQVLVGGMETGQIIHFVPESSLTLI